MNITLTNDLDFSSGNLVVDPTDSYLMSVKYSRSKKSCLPERSSKAVASNVVLLLQLLLFNTSLFEKSTTETERMQTVGLYTNNMFRLARYKCLSFPRLTYCKVCSMVFFQFKNSHRDFLLDSRFCMKNFELIDFVRVMKCDGINEGSVNIGSNSSTIGNQMILVRPCEMSLWYQNRRKVSITFTLGPAYKEFGYNEHPATMSRFHCIKIIDCNLKKFGYNEQFFLHLFTRSKCNPV